MFFMSCVCVYIYIMCVYTRVTAKITLFDGVDTNV